MNSESSGSASQVGEMLSDQRYTEAGTEADVSGIIMSGGITLQQMRLSFAKDP